MSTFPSLNPDDLAALTAGYALNTLSSQEVEEFERALKADAQVQQQLQTHQEILGLLAHTAPAIAAPERLRTKILAAITSESQPQHLQPQTSQPQSLQQLNPPAQKILQMPNRRTNRWQIGISLAAASLLFALGIHTYQMDRKLRLLESTLSSLQGKETYVFAMRGQAETQAASGSVILDLEAKTATIALQNLPSLPKGEIYTLWAQTRDKRIFCGQLQSKTGKIVEQIAIPKDAYSTEAESMQLFRAMATDPMQQQPDHLVMVSHSPSEEI